jgi:hypothetical protein
MTARQLIVEFVNVVFTILVISFFVLFVIVGGRLELISEFMKMLVPISLFLLILMIRFRISRNIYKNKQQDEETDLTLYLSYFDKMKVELVVYGLPILILLPSLIAQSMDQADIVQALIAFIAGWYVLRIIFVSDKL